jgi:hypothetical protein
MKNLLIYTGPNKKFSKEDSVLAKIQIDNSLDLGWKKEDILLVTDFEYEYNGVRSFVIKKDIYYKFDLNANKLPVVLYLINQNKLKSKEIYWCHDFDAYELNKINENELGLGNFDLGLVPYFYKAEWQFGSFFFRNSAKDILELIDQTAKTKPHLSRNNEKTLTKLIKNYAIDSKRYKELNVTYSIMKRCLQTVYNEAIKPIKVLHFRPSDPKDNQMPDSALNMFMYGKNRLKIPLMSDRLIKIFKYHGIK